MNYVAVEELAQRLMGAIFMPAASDSEVISFLQRVIGYPPIAGVFVDQVRIAMAADILGSVGIGVGTAAAYPLGNKSTETKVAAIRYAITAGAVEIDVGAHFAAIKSGDFKALEKDTRAMVDAAADDIRLVPIPETAILTNGEKMRTLEVFANCGVKAIKTSSGYGWNTPIEDVLFIRRNFGDAFQVDVSGGVRTYDETIRMIEAGGRRIHTSRVFEILDHAMEERL